MLMLLPFSWLHSSAPTLKAKCGWSFNIELSAWPVLSIIRIGAFYHALVSVWIGSANKWHCGKEATLIL